MVNYWYLDYFNIKICKFMLNKIKKNWKNILIGVLLLFSLSKCTQSCNRSINIDELNKKVSYQDSVISCYKIQVDQLQKDTAQYIEKLNVYKSFNETMSNNIAQQNEIAKQNAKNNAKLLRELNNNSINNNSINNNNNSNK